MITTKLPRMWILSLAALAACQLPPELLDAGDDETLGDGTETDDVTGDETGEETDDETGDETGDETDELECVLQGTNVYGGTELMNWNLPLDECSVICAEGWGHDVPLLESEWTGDVEPYTWITQLPTRASLVLGSDRVYLVASAPDDYYHIHDFRPDGTSGLRTGSMMQDEILDAGLDDFGEFVFLWTDGETQYLRWRSDMAINGVRWDLELGPHHGEASRLVVVDNTAFVALDDGDHRLLRIDYDGNIEFDEPIPPTTRMDLSPSGDVLVLANDTAISWVSMQGHFVGVEPIAGVQALLDIVALDDNRVAYVGHESDGSPNSARAIVRTHGATGPGWSHTYDRAETWCVEYDIGRTDEEFTGVAQLGDGSLIVIGNESRGAGPLAHRSQPWVAHVSADGQVLAYDRGFWEGNAVDVVARDNVAYVLFADVDPEPGGHVGLAMLRKYVL